MLDTFTVRFSGVRYTAGMKFSSFAVAAVLLLVLAAHTRVTDAAAFGEVSVTEAYRLKQEP